MATQLFENGIFCRKFPVFEKKIRQKATENWFFWGWCRHIYAYWLQFSEFLEIILQLSQNLPRDARHSGYIRKLKKKTGCTCFSTMEPDKNGLLPGTVFSQRPFVFSMMAWHLLEN
jgi:hypothetical protein